MTQNRLSIRKAAVLGTGVMGAQIAAHLVNAKIPCVLFGLTESSSPNAHAEAALEQLKKLDPAPLSRNDLALYIEPANYDQHVESLKECDLVIEAIAEDINLKIGLYKKIAPYLRTDAILASNTSGLSINQLALALPKEVQARFCGIHFFNPPRYMHLVELIPATATDPLLLDELEAFLVCALGKGVIRAPDTPNFIANRVGVFSMLATLYHAERLGLAPDLVDALTGPAIGRAKSATFRTLDVVGLDIFVHVVRTMRDTLPTDPWHQYFEMPGWLQDLVAQGALGQKSKRGVYHKEDKSILVWDTSTRAYRPSSRELSGEAAGLLKAKDRATQFDLWRRSSSKEGQFLWSIYRDLFHYCAIHLGEVADNARDLDLAIRWGFGWTAGPFEIWQQAGWKEIATAIEENVKKGEALASVPLPDWVHEQNGPHQEGGSFSVASHSFKPRRNLGIYTRQFFPDQVLNETGTRIFTRYQNTDISLWDTGDDIGILSFHSKMHIIGEAVLDGMLHAIDYAEQNLKALVIWHRDAPFSAGANLVDLMRAVQIPAPDSGMQGKLKQAAQRVKYSIAGHAGFKKTLQALSGSGVTAGEIIERFQYANQRLKYASIPTVAAVHGLALGGGCEIAMHCDRIVAALESYIGLVEAGVGLLPAGGGCKEATLRAAEEAKGGDLMPFLRVYFQNIGMAEVAKSAEQAKQMGYLRGCDQVVMNTFELLYVAKANALALAEAGYRPPLPPQQIPVAGKTGIATFKTILTNMVQGGFISDHDYKIGAKIATVLCGGEIEAGSRVDEIWLLRLERDHFLELLASEKSQARIEHTLKTGKPLRN